MKAFSRKLPRELKNIEILVLSDYHYADSRSDHEAIKRDIEYVRKHNNAYCVLAGDLMDCALKSSLGDVYTNLSPMEELSACMELLGPIADKVLAAVGGNHEARHYKTNGIDMTRLLARQLGFEKYYSDETAYIFLRLGEDKRPEWRKAQVCYGIYLTHGSGGGRKEGGKIQRLVDYSNIVDADVYICGHTHLPASLKTGFIRPSFSSSSLVPQSKLFVNAAASLNYGGYGEIGGYRPPCKDTPRILLSGTEKEMRALI